VVWGFAKLKLSVYYSTLQTQFHQTYSRRLKKHSNTVAAGEFNTPLSPIYRSSKQKINKEILELNDTINQMYLIDVYRIFHSTKEQYTFFSAAHGISPK
jgi:exonuclease III